MSFLDSMMGAVRKFSTKKSNLSSVKESMEPAPPIRLPSEDALKAYESRYEDKMPPRTPVDVLRDPQLPAAQQQYPFSPPVYPAQQNAQKTFEPASPKIDLILAEIETVKAQLKVLSEKLDILESHYKKSY